MADKKEPRLQRGDWAPDFQALGVNGEAFSLSLASTDGIWLAFYRYASCPMCNMHFDDVLSRRELLKQNGIQFVAIFESEPKNFPKRFMDQTFEQVSMIPDPKRELYDYYRIENKWLGLVTPQSITKRIEAGIKGYSEGVIDGRANTIPAHFLILPGGYIHQAYYGSNIADHLKWRDLDEYCQALEGVRKQRTAAAPKVNLEEDDKTEIIMRDDGISRRRRG